MARFVEDDAAVGIGLYAELLAAEEEKFARHGGHRMLIDDQMVVAAYPSPKLAAMREGQPVEFNDWQLPRWARSGKVEDRRLIIHLDGRVEQVD